MNHVVIRNNVFIGLDNGAVGGNGRLFQISDIIPNLTIEHNTGFSPSNSSFIWSGDLPLPNHIVRNNLVGGGHINCSRRGDRAKSRGITRAGPGSIFDQQRRGGVHGRYDDRRELGVNYWLAGRCGACRGQRPRRRVQPRRSTTWRAPGECSYKRQGTDGSDPGANIAVVKAATANVVRQ